MDYVPRIVPDRDNYRKWYLDEDFRTALTDGTVLIIKKGYRFNGHSTGILGFLLRDHSGSDIVAALVHDYLLDTMPWHRFTRKFIDDEYWLFHQLYSHSKIRTFLMPKGVYFWGFVKTLGYRDFRGEIKPNTVVEVIVTHDGVV